MGGLFLCFSFVSSQVLVTFLFVSFEFYSCLHTNNKFSDCMKSLFSIGDLVKVRHTKIIGRITKLYEVREKVEPYYKIPVVVLKLEDGTDMEYNESEITKNID